MTDKNPIADKRINIRLELGNGFERKEFMDLMYLECEKNIILEYGYDLETAQKKAREIIAANFNNRKEPEEVCFLVAIDIETSLEVGGVFILFYPEYNSALGDTMIVYPRFRGYGIARQIMNQAEDYMRSVGVKNVGIGVMYDNEIAVNLYKRKKYEPIILHFEKWL